jgi:hypothetical protein
VFGNRRWTTNTVATVQNFSMLAAAFADEDTAVGSSGFPPTPAFDPDMNDSMHSKRVKKIPENAQELTLFPPEDDPEDATLVSETMQGSGSISFMESIDNSTSMIASPSKMDVCPGSVLQRNRMKKRTIESQLTAWREGIGRTKVTKPSSMKNIGDGPPPLVDWEESESDLASFQTGTNNSRNDRSFVDSMGASSSTRSMPVLVDYDAPEDSLRLCQFSRAGGGTKISSDLDVTNGSVDEESMSSSGIFSTTQAPKHLKSSFRRASMGSVPLTSARVTTGGWISNIIFNDETEITSRTDTTNGRMHSPRASPRMRIKKERRSSLGSDGLPNSDYISSPRGGNLNAFMSEQNGPLDPDHILSPGKVILHCRPRGSKSILSGDSNMTSERTGTVSQRRRVKSEGYTRSSRFPEKGRVSSAASSVSTGKSDRSKSSTPARQQGKTSSREMKSADMKQDVETSSVASYETLHSCSTRKQILRMNSGGSMASSIDSMGKDENPTKPSKLVPANTAKRQGRRNSTGFVTTIEQNISVALKMDMHLKHERRGSTGSSMPKPPLITVDSIPIGKINQSKAQSERNLNIDTNFRAPCRTSTGTTSSTNHVDGQQPPQVNLDILGHDHVRQNRRMSAGNSSRYAPVTARLKEEISQVALKPKHPSSGRSVSSVDLWNGSNTTACTSSVSSWRSNGEGEKPSSVLSSSSSKNSKMKLESPLAVQTKKLVSQEENLQTPSSNDDMIDHASPSRSRRIMSRLNIFKPKRGSTVGGSLGNRQRRRASADGATADGQNNEYLPSRQQGYRPKGPRARRRASTGAVSDPVIDNPSHPIHLTTTGAVFPQEPVRLVPPKKSARAGRRLSLGLLRVSAKN